MILPLIHPQCRCFHLPCSSGPCLHASVTQLLRTPAVISEPTKVASEERSHSPHLPGTCFLERERCCLARACWVASFESDVAPCLPAPALEMVFGEPDTRFQPPSPQPLLVGETRSSGKDPAAPAPQGLVTAFPFTAPWTPEVGAIARESQWHGSH